MAFYESQTWQAPGRQSSWEAPPPPSRSGTSSTSQQREDGLAFADQFEEVERAIDNLIKSGKFYNQGNRRESMPMMMGSRGYQDYGNPRMHGGMNRHSMTEFDQSRSPGGSNLQNFYASQRYQGRSEADQMARAKRQMAAQRERDLRNYHQEQQYNRSLLAEMSSGKSDRSMSPAQSEEGRRELIARQHRALYGNEAPQFFPSASFSEESGSRPETQGSIAGAAPAPSMRGPSPRNRDPFGMAPASAKSTDPSSSITQEAVRANNPSPGSGPNTASFAAFEPAAQQANKTHSPTGRESPSRQAQKSATAPIGSGMGPIGSRPVQQQAANPNLNKRSTTPLPSPLTYISNDQPNSSNTERSGSAASNSGNKDSGNVWGNGSGVWGAKSSLGATSAVWG
ncbi:MAG: hypothetical protein Q9227_006373 [Pyrenula ochraceoflavens]